MTTEQIKVSFVMPVYNAMPYLTQCLDSVCEQTLKEIELICVDDGSNDDSFSKLQQYAKKDPRIKVFQNKQEGPGAAHARNLGLSQAKGDYVIVVDSDDYFHLELAEKVYKKAIKTNAEVILYDAMWFDTHTGKDMKNVTTLRKDLLPDEESFSGQDISKVLFQITHGAAWSRCYKKSYLDQYKFQFQSVHVIDDVFFTYTSLSLAKKISLIEETLLFYRVNNGKSQLSNKDRDPYSPVKVISALKLWLKKHDVFDCYEETYLKLAISICIFYLDGMKSQENIDALFVYLHEGGLEDLGIYPAPFLHESIKNWIENVQKLDKMSYFSMKKANESSLVTPGMRCGIYGLGFRGELVLEKINHLGGVIVAASDSSQEKWGEVFCGLNILPPQELNPKEIDRVFIASFNYFGEIKERLLHLGFAAEQISFI